MVVTVVVLTQPKEGWDCDLANPRCPSDSQCKRTWDTNYDKQSQYNGSESQGHWFPKREPGFDLEGTCCLINPVNSDPNNPPYCLLQDQLPISPKWCYAPEDENGVKQIRAQCGGTNMTCSHLYTGNCVPMREAGVVCDNSAGRWFGGSATCKSGYCGKGLYYTGATWGSFSRPDLCCSDYGADADGFCVGLPLKSSCTKNSQCLGNEDTGSAPGPFARDQRAYCGSVARREIKDGLYEDDAAAKASASVVNISVGYECTLKSESAPCVGSYQCTSGVCGHLGSDDKQNCCPGVNAALGSNGRCTGIAEGYPCLDTVQCDPAQSDGLGGTYALVCNSITNTCTKAKSFGEACGTSQDCVSNQCHQIDSGSEERCCGHSYNGLWGGVVDLVKCSGVATAPVKDEQMTGGVIWRQLTSFKGFAEFTGCTSDYQCTAPDATDPTLQMPQTGFDSNSPFYGWSESQLALAKGTSGDPALEGYTPLLPGFGHCRDNYCHPRTPVGSPCTQDKQCPYIANEANDVVPSHWTTVSPRGHPGYPGSNPMRPGLCRQQHNEETRCCPFGSIAYGAQFVDYLKCTVGESAYCFLDDNNCMQDGGAPLTCSTYQRDGGPPTCQRPRPLGGACMNDDGCQGAGSTAFCAGATSGIIGQGVCTAYKKVGESCLGSSDCRLVVPGENGADATVYEGQCHRYSSSTESWEEGSDSSNPTLVSEAEKTKCCSYDATGNFGGPYNMVACPHVSVCPSVDESIQTSPFYQYKYTLKEWCMCEDEAQCTGPDNEIVGQTPTANMWHSSDLASANKGKYRCKPASEFLTQEERTLNGRVYNGKICVHRYKTYKQCSNNDGGDAFDWKCDYVSNSVPPPDVFQLPQGHDTTIPQPGNFPNRDGLCAFHHGNTLSYCCPFGSTMAANGFCLVELNAYCDVDQQNCMQPAGSNGGQIRGCYWREDAPGQPATCQDRTQLAANEACYNDAHCASGKCAYQTTGDQKHCCGDGATIDGNGWCMSQAVGARCQDGNHAQCSSDFCTGNSGEMTCHPKLGTGAACSGAGPSACQSGTCKELGDDTMPGYLYSCCPTADNDGKYCTELDTGSDCWENLQCRSRLCGRNSADTVYGCEAKRAEAQPCGEDLNCQSNACGNYWETGQTHCCPSGRSGADCNNLGIGKSCYLTSQCSGGYCKDGTCTARLAEAATCTDNMECNSLSCAHYWTFDHYSCCPSSHAGSQGSQRRCNNLADGKSCLAGDMCASNYCNSNGACESLIADAYPCSADSQCQSGLCGKYHDFAGYLCCPKGGGKSWDWCNGLPSLYGCKYSDQCSNWQHPNGWIRHGCTGEWNHNVQGNLIGHCYTVYEPKSCESNCGTSGNECAWFCGGAHACCRHNYFMGGCTWQNKPNLDGSFKCILMDDGTGTFRGSLLGQNATSSSTLLANPMDSVAVHPLLVRPVFLSGANTTANCKNYSHLPADPDHCEYFAINGNATFKSVNSLTQPYGCIRMADGNYEFNHKQESVLFCGNNGGQCACLVPTSAFPIPASKRDSILSSPRNPSMPPGRPSSPSPPPPNPRMPPPPSKPRSPLWRLTTRAE